MPPTPNYFYRNFALGRTHTGMIAHLCDHFNAGTQAPLRRLLSALGLELPGGLASIQAQFEFKQADLGLFDGDHCFLLVEMKVDDREGLKRAKKVDVVDASDKRYAGSTQISEGQYYQQTLLYTHRGHQHNVWAADAQRARKEGREPYAGHFMPSARPTVWLVTLGVGDSVADSGAIGLADWYEAVAAADLRDATAQGAAPLFNQYLAALQRELEVVASACSTDGGWRSSVSALPPRAPQHGAMYRLIQLRKQITQPESWTEDFGWNPIVKTEGAQGDVILQFNYPPESAPWRKRYPLFLELMGSGILKFKLAALLIDGRAARRAAHDAILLQMGFRGGERMTGQLQRPTRQYNPETTNHLTLAEWPVGLTADAQLQEGINGIDEVVRRVREGLERYGSLMGELLRLGSET